MNRQPQPAQVEQLYRVISVEERLPADKEEYVHTLIAGKTPCGNKPKNFKRVGATHWLEPISSAQPPKLFTEQQIREAMRHAVEIGGNTDADTEQEISEYLTDLTTQIKEQ